MKTTNRILLTLFVLILIGITLSLVYIRTHISGNVEQQGSGNIISETRDIETFQALKVSGIFNVTLYKNDYNKLTINSYEDMIEFISIQVHDDELQITFDQPGKFVMHKQIDIDLYYNQLSAIDVDAGAKVSTTDTLHAAIFRHTVSSGSQSNLTLNVDVLELESIAGARAVLYGYARTVSAEISSGAQIRANDLSAELYQINASSGANAQINAEKELSGHASSGSSIRYKGSPVLKDFSTSGGANVRPI